MGENKKKEEGKRELKEALKKFISNKGVLPILDLLHQAINELADEQYPIYYGGSYTEREMIIKQTKKRRRLKNVLGRSD